MAKVRIKPFGEAPPSPQALEGGGERKEEEGGAGEGGGGNVESAN